MTVQVLPCWPSGKVSGSTATDMSLIPALAWISFWVESHNSSWKFSTPVATMSGALHCRVSTGTGWAGVSILTWWDRWFDLQLLSQCGSTYNCLSRSVPRKHHYVAGVLSNQPSPTTTVQAWFMSAGMFVLPCGKSVTCTGGTMAKREKHWHHFLAVSNANLGWLLDGWSPQLCH